MDRHVEEIREESRRILDAWIVSCKRGGKVSRNTIAVGIVVLDHLRKVDASASGVLAKEEVLSQGGEIRGARSGLGAILASYGIPNRYLKEATTRQAHQDGQRLLQDLGWGGQFAGLPALERDRLLTELIAGLVSYANEWFLRQNLKVVLDRRQSPVTWARAITAIAKGRSGGVVEQHLVGAKLERRFREIAVPNHPAHAADQQTARDGDFAIAGNVYHVTAAPGQSVVQKCHRNLQIGLRPILLVPEELKAKAFFLAQQEGIDEELTILALEDFVALNIIELAIGESKELFGVLQEIIALYNQRLEAVETNLALRIEIQ